MDRLARAELRMNCSNCAAPIPVRSNICRFCGTVNDTDLRHVRGAASIEPPGERPCPRCDVRMNPVDLGAEGEFIIERCGRCFGLFFDAGELELLIETSTSDVARIDRAKMTSLVEEEGGVESVVKYARCPDCREFMNRKNYGARSGVVVDTCKTHGIWLDAGELRRILNWARAGGQIHDERRKTEEIDKAARRDRAAKVLESERSYGGLGSELGESDPWVVGLLGILVRLFR